ncbi:MAG TPA: hypothetical protein VM940_13425 [Chthoniobacterales bacterium]|jgi:hypothetical protein|nr:hypothetical protein [Chthoniobacterales bacterium]
MRYHIKTPGAFLWKPLVTDSLAAEREQGRVKGDWKIRNDNDSTDYTVDELCQLEAERKTAAPSAAAAVPSPDAGSKVDFTDNTPLPRGAKGFFFLAIYLILTFLYRVLVTAHEYDSVAVVYMSIGLDLAMIAGLILGKIAISRQITAHQRRGLVTIVFVVALLAGVGLLGLRITSDAGWWTGHLRYEF